MASADGVDGIEYFAGCVRDRRARAKNQGDTPLLQKRIVLLGNNATSDHYDIVRTLLAQRINQLGHKRLVTCRQTGCPHNMHVILYGLPGHLLGR